MVNSNFNTLKMEGDLEYTLDKMDAYGGSFVRGLASLYRKADLVNKQKLLVAFSEYFIEYGSK